MLEFTFGLTGAQRQVEIVRQADPAIMAKFARGGTPDANGMVGTNKTGWQGAQYQRTFLHDVLYAIQQNDLGRANDAWRAVDATYLRQVLSGPRVGGFASLTTSYAQSADKDDVSDTSFWLSWSLQAILALSASPFWPQFESRVEELLPKIRLAGDYLSGNRQLLVARDASTPNRLFITANALLFSGIVLGEPSLFYGADTFVRLGINTWTADGYFAEYGGYDSSYNAVSLWQLELYNTYNYSQERADAIAASMAWELTRIEPTGHVISTGNSRTAGQETYQGSIKTIDYQSVLLALLYGQRWADASSVYTYWVWGGRLPQ